MRLNGKLRRVSLKVGLTTVAAFCLGLLVNEVWLTAVQGSYGRTPFTAKLQRVYLDADGETVLLREVNTEGYRSDGSVAYSMVHHAPRLGDTPAGSARRREILDVASGKKYWIVSAIESLSSEPLNQTTLRHLATKPDCLAEKVKGWGTQTIEMDPTPKYALGHRVIKKTVDVEPGPVGPDGATEASRIEEWVAPELDCFPLRRVDTYIAPTTGEEKVGMRYEVFAVIPGEPEEALFEIPDYTERSPSEMAQELANHHGQPYESGDHVALLEHLYQKRLAESR